MEDSSESFALEWISMDRGKSSFLSDLPKDVSKYYPKEIPKIRTLRICLLSLCESLKINTFKKLALIFENRLIPTASVDFYFVKSSKNYALFIFLFYLLRSSDLSNGIWVGLVKPRTTNDVIKYKSCDATTIGQYVNNIGTSLQQCVYFNVFTPNTHLDNFYASSCEDRRSYMCLSTATAGKLCSSSVKCTVLINLFIIYDQNLG